MRRWVLGRRMEPPAPVESLYDRVYRIETLTRAWKHIRRGGGAGVDGLTVRAFEQHWAEQMAELAALLQARRYHPLPLRGFLLPRGDGRNRPISLLTLRDRVAQRAVLEVVQPLFAAAASPAAFGVLPGRAVAQALARAEEARSVGNTWAARADIHHFFEEVDRRRALQAFHAVVPDKQLVALVAEWLAMDILRPPMSPGSTAEPASLAPPRYEGITSWLDGISVPASELGEVAPAVVSLAGRLGRWALSVWMGRRTSTTLAAGAVALAAALTPLLVRRLGRTADEDVPVGKGTPQGAPLSPLLATAVLHPLDVALDQPGRVLVRYVDDMLLVCRDERTARDGLHEIDRQLTRLGLRLSQGKTLVQPYDAGFTFLGVELPRFLVDESVAGAFRGTAYWRARVGMMHRERKGSGR